MKDWKTIVSHSVTHEPLIMRLHLEQNCYIDLVGGNGGEEHGDGQIKAVFRLGVDGGTKLEKTFYKVSQKPLNMETEWAEDQAWNCLQEISDKARCALELLIPDSKQKGE